MRQIVKKDDIVFHLKVNPGGDLLDLRTQKFLMDAADNVNQKIISFTKDGIIIEPITIYVP